MVSVGATAEKRRIRRIYDGLAPRYDRLEALPDRLVIGRYRRVLATLARGRVLEVAGGTGRNLPYYPAGVELTLSDISQGMLRQAAASAQRLQRPLTLVLADAAALPFAAASFDTVLCSLSLCTVPDPVAVAQEMARVCQPQGLILLLEHVRSPLRLVAWVQGRLSPWQVRRLGCHLDRDTLSALGQAGLAIQEVKAHLLGIFILVVASPSPVAK